MTKIKKIFIVGSSRSGTTMMGRILGNHQDVFTFKELHFFGTLWTNQSSKCISRDDQVRLLSRLLCIQKNGLFNQHRLYDFEAKAKILLTNKNLDPLEIFELFLQYITKSNKAVISCEQTPQNIYYLEEILSHFPDAKVINMIRDQRDVLLSQKNKWKRRFLGATAIPLSEAIRSFVNYHPILTSKVWKSSLEHSLKFSDNDRVKMIRFEDVLSDPQNRIKDICSFLGIEFDREMLNIPLIGSSTEEDIRDKLQIDISKIQKWKSGGLSNAEIYLSQIITGDIMLKFNYQIKQISFPPITLIYYIFILPVKLVLAFLLNIHRMGSVIEVMKKRFF